MIDLVTPWADFFGMFGGSGFWRVVAILGVTIIVVAIATWWYKSGKGAGGMSLKSAPWTWIILGVLLASPQWFMPFILRIIGALLTLIVMIFDWAIALL